MQLLRMRAHSPLPCTITHPTSLLQGICLVMYTTSAWGVYINLLPMDTMRPTQDPIPNMSSGTSAE
jgi:hypothetical protein